jgi:mannose-1-phosphate guanylyltransferase
MGTHAALAARIGAPRDRNVVFGKAVVTGTGNSILANTDQCVVVASDDLTVVVTDNAVFVGDRNTDMKVLMEKVAQQLPEIV